MRERDCDCVDKVHDLSVLARETSGPWTAAALRTGRFRAVICESCGFTEWYATGLDQRLVAAVLADPNSGVQRIQG